MLRLTNASLLAQGANLVDSITGFRGYSDLVAKAATATTSCSRTNSGWYPDRCSARPTWPSRCSTTSSCCRSRLTRRPFFLIPGDNQVTVIWSPSASENSGDPYFADRQRGAGDRSASGLLVSNSLYDPNYRQFDVEGYRVYRGRIDAPNELTLLAQFDYTGTYHDDYTGVVMPTSDLRAGSESARRLPGGVSGRRQPEERHDPDGAHRL